MMRLDILYPDSFGPGVPKGEPSRVLEPQLCVLEELYQTKVAEHPHLSGSGSPLWTSNPDLEIPGHGVLLAPLCLTLY